MTRTILLQLDSDRQPSSFDSVVAVDAGVDCLLPFGGVTVDSVTSTVHGAMFTRGGDDLRKTAIFVGGSNVSAAEELFSKVKETFFGPVRVSVMLDANGCNTTASAAVVYAARHSDLSKSRALVLGGTGPVGRRVALLLATEGADVRLASRSIDRAQQACDEIVEGTTLGNLSPAAPDSDAALSRLLSECEIVIACGAAGAQLASSSILAKATELRVAIDLNAVPPAGLEGIGVTDKARPINGSESGAVGYGAIGVGGLKMKTHRAAIGSLFEANDRVLDAEAIYAIAKSIA